MSEQQTASAGIIDRTLERIGRAFRGVAGSAKVALTGGYRADLPDEDIVRLQRQIALCLDERGGEVSARTRAADLGRTYLSLAASGRLRFLKLLARDFHIDRAAIGATIAGWQISEQDPVARAVAEQELRHLLVPPSIRLLSQFNGLPEGVKFLVDLRADLMRLVKQEPILAPLADELRTLLAGWFDVGFLNLERITWNSPATLLEKLIDYEAVHAISSWRDMKKRLGSDRRCFAFFHPRMPEEPLIFVEVALVGGLASSVQSLLDESQPALDARKADTAIFYSISNCQRGLNGVSFGNFLIKRVVDLLASELPNTKTFATLSPVPGFLSWLQSDAAESSGELSIAIAAAGVGKGSIAEMLAVLRRPDWHRDPALAEGLHGPLLTLAARYLLQAKRGNSALDRVAHFHLTNGARIERLNWLADTSANGLGQSAGIMVNYRYKLDEIDDNHEGYAGKGEIAATAAVRRLLKP
jgi:malonyl-CoA decarboxylase